MSLLMFCDSIKVSLKTGPAIIDITPELIELIRKSKISTGQLAATMVGSTGSLTTIEFEPGVVAESGGYPARIRCGCRSRALAHDGATGIVFR